MDSPIQASTRGNNWATPVHPAKGDPVAPATPSSLLLQPAPTPEWPPPNAIFLAAITNALAWHPPPRSKPVLKFQYSCILMCCGNTEMVGSWNTRNRIISYFIECDEQQKQDGNGACVGLPRIHCDHFSNKHLQFWNSLPFRRCQLHNGECATAAA